MEVYKKINSITFKTKKDLGCLLLLTSIVTASIFLSFGLYVYNAKNSKDSHTTSVAEIVTYRSSRNYSAPIFYYNVNGEEYTCLIKVHSTLSPTPEERKIYYDSKNPSNCISEYEVSLTYKYSKPIIIVTILEFLISLYILLSLLMTQLKIKRLKKSGLLIKGLHCTIKNTQTATLNNSGFYILIDYITPDGTLLKLKSDIKYYKHIVNINKADLLINPSNPKEYYISFDIPDIVINM